MVHAAILWTVTRAPAAEPRRVVLVGKNRAAVAALDTIRAAGDEIACVVVDPGDTGEDGWQPSLRRIAAASGDRIEAPLNLNDPAFVEILRSLAPDILVSIQAAQIMRRPLLETPRLGAVNLHFGPLPRYRGVAPIAWAIINGETETAVTLHTIDPGIDSGPILASAPVTIGRDETARSLYDRCTQAAVDLFGAEWPRIRRGDLDGRPQTGTALYYNRHSIDFSRRAISWQRDARDVANWIRAFIFPPLQLPHVTVAGSPIEVGAVGWDREPHAGRPGEVLEVADGHMVVAAPGGRVRLGELSRDGEVLTGSGLADAGFVPGLVLS
jgi:methionyl-tRNA formyltransferase